MATKNHPSKITLSELQAAIAAVHSETCADILTNRPHGYFSAGEYAQQCGISQQAAHRMLENLVARKKLYRVRARYVLSAGYYRTGILYGKTKVK